jgi:ribosome-associated protein
MEARAKGEVDSAALARRLARIADSKQATEVVALDMRELVGYTDYLVLATARNERLAKAISDDVREALKRDGLLPARAEGAAHSQWILLDYLDAVLHVFVPETRDRYRLDQLWGEAPRLELGLDGGEADAATG